VRDATTPGATSLGTALTDLALRLSDAGVPEPRLDARLLLAHAAEVAPQTILLNPERALSSAARARLDALVRRRLDREPVSRILGRRAFWTLDLALSPATLDPRPDSETLIEAVLAALPDKTLSRRVLDLGTGTGCLLLALLSEWPAATGLGIDVAPDAIATAEGNARSAGVEARARFARGDWGTGLDGPYDVIVSNPPYIPTGTIANLMPEVARHDPLAALDGGPDGLAAYRRLAPDLARMLALEGLAVLEHGEGQADAVAEIMGGHGLVERGRRADLAGRQRCLLLGRGPGTLPGG
jgi:release factor glutamine methyltransferase